ncbi:LysR family transcriptional regulator [Lachnospiraceae bacterium NSJ-143]|nr:LysR family transcriptional regulator [Lachnospiraceae bacterium NSJ-143]
MNYSQLVYFSTLAHIEHYTKAAELLGISQPSLSHAISNLEQELGIYLFEKQGRNVRLTRYGKVYLTYVDAALDELEKGNKQMNRFSDIEAGTIRIGCISSASPSVSVIISKYMEKHSAVNFVFEQSTTKKLLEGLSGEAYDMVFCHKLKDYDAVDFVPMVERDIVIKVYRGHPLEVYDSISLSQLGDYPVITYNRQGGARPYIDRMFITAGVKPNICCQVSEDIAAASLILQKAGAAVVVDHSIFNIYDFKTIYIKDADFKVPMNLATMKNSFLAGAAQDFKRFIIANKNLL